jgi:hypothetical protein
MTARIAPTPFTRWDLERVFYGNPLLSPAERKTAVLILKSWDNKLRPVDCHLASQALIGFWAGHWRSTICRAVRKLVVLGYFRTTWRTVQRKTKQGIRGVTRVYVTPGPEMLRLLQAPSDVSAGDGRGVTSDHPSRPLPARSVAVSDGVIANSADRKGPEPSDSRNDRRKALAEWPRLAGSRPITAGRLLSAVPFADLEFSTAGAEIPGYTDLSDDEAAARLEAKRRAAAEALREDLARRQQPRRHRRR